MNSNSFLLGVHREDGHSPRHEHNDPAILQTAAAELCRRGHRVRLSRPDNLARELVTGPSLIFAMCETPVILAALDDQVANGVPVFNTPASIRNTYRYRMIRELARAPIRTPAAEVVRLAGIPRWIHRPVWLKRYDYHATGPDDVLFADSATLWNAAVESFHSRGFAMAIVQDHVPGDLIKFYGVGNRWFRWFHDESKPVAGHSFDSVALATAAAAAAAALGVAIFGGDAIVGPEQTPIIIDLNAWPSYARFRAEAGTIIAEFLEASMADRSRAASAASL